jgi:uncharacterized membrane protein
MQASLSPQSFASTTVLPAGFANAAPRLETLFAPTVDRRSTIDAILLMRSLLPSLMLSSELAKCELEQLAAWIAPLFGSNT